jgi:hypothetical protein
MFKLVDGAHLWHKLWSVRLGILSAVLGVLAEVLPMWFPDVPYRTMALISTLLAAAAAIASLIKQPKLLEALKDK